MSRRAKWFAWLFAGMIFQHTASAQEIDLNRQYMIIRDGQTQEGPFSLARIKEMAVSGKTLVWYPGLMEWVYAEKLPELQPDIQHFKVIKDCERAGDTYSSACFDKVVWTLQHYVHINAKLVEEFDKARPSYEHYSRYAAIASISQDEVRYFQSIMPKLWAEFKWENPIRSERQYAWYTTFDTLDKYLQYFLESYARILDISNKQLPAYEARLNAIEKKMIAAAERGNNEEYERLFREGTEIDPTFLGNTFGVNYMSVALKNDVKYKIQSTSVASGWVDIQLGAIRKAVPVSSLQTISLSPLAGLQDTYKLGEKAEFRFGKSNSKTAQVDEEWRYATAGMKEISVSGFYLDPMLPGASLGMFTGRLGISGYPVNIFHLGGQVAPTWMSSTGIGWNLGFPIGFTFDLKKFYFDVSGFYNFYKTGSQAAVHSIQGAATLKFILADHVLLNIGIESGRTIGGTSRSSGITIPFGIAVAF